MPPAAQGPFFGGAIFGDGIGVPLGGRLQPGTLGAELRDFLERDVPGFIENKALEEGIERTLRMSKKLGKIFEQFTDPPSSNTIEAREEAEFIRRRVAELRSERPDLFTELGLVSGGEVPTFEDILRGMQKKELLQLLARANARPVTPQLAMDRTDP